MVFYWFLVAVAIGLAVFFIRSPIVRKLRRRHGIGRAPFSSSRDHALGHTILGKVDPLGQSKPRDQG